MANMGIDNDKMFDSKECDAIFSLYADKLLLCAEGFAKNWDSEEKRSNTKKFAEGIVCFYKRVIKLGEVLAPILEKKYLNGCDAKDVEDPVKKTLEIDKDIHKLSKKIEQLQTKSEEEESENEIDSLRQLCSNILEEVSTNNSVQSVLSEDLQLQLTEMNEQRQQLLDDLKRQEDAHLQEIELLTKQNKSELEARDMRCLELDQEIERLRGDNDINLSCSICLEPWSSEGTHRLCCLPCGHLFGSTCINDYLYRCAQCPQCRTPTNVSGMRYLFGRPY